jgi:hypothetical protein
MIPDLSTRGLWQIPAETASSEAGKTWREMVVNFAYNYSFSHLQGFLI